MSDEGQQIDFYGWELFWRALNSLAFVIPLSAKKETTQGKMLAGSYGARLSSDKSRMTDLQTGKSS